MQWSWHLFNCSLRLHKNVQVLFFRRMDYLHSNLAKLQFVNRQINCGTIFAKKLPLCMTIPFNKIGCWNYSKIYCLSIHSFCTSLFLKGLKTSTEFPETSCWVSSVKKYQTIKYWKKNCVPLTQQQKASVQWNEKALQEKYLLYQVAANQACQHQVYPRNKEKHFL